MAKVRLKRLLSQKKRGTSILQGIEALTSHITVLDAQQNILSGEDGDDNAHQYPILSGDVPVGWVKGRGQAELVATLLTHLVGKEVENDDLADELLGLYREINLLFHLSEKLSSSLSVNVVMEITLKESRQLIRATSGAIILGDDTSETFTSRYIFGKEIDPETRYLPHQGVIGNLIVKPDGEIINDVPSDKRYISQDGNYSSLICAPLKAEQRVIGLLLLVSREPIMYTSPDLVLLTTVASQAAPAIANALLHEQTIREAQERETQLQMQIKQLQIELDGTKVDEAVTEIVEADYFKQIREQSDNLRSIMDGNLDQDVRE